MKLSPLLLILIFAPTAHGFLEDLIFIIIELILTPILPLIVPPICAGGLEALNLDGLVTCTCTGGFQAEGIVGTADCELNDPICLDEGGFLCAATEFGATFVAGGEGLTGDIDACFEISTGLPPGIEDIADLKNPLCLSAQAEGLELTECTITLGGDACDCEVCDLEEDGGFFSFDCKSVDLFLGFGGPASDGCIGLAFN